MRSFISKTIACAILATGLNSFSPKPGGEGFEIYLNNKVIMQQFGSNMDNVKTLELGTVSANDKLTIKYFHCGRAGKNRIISIKNDKNKTLKELHFGDASSPQAGMVINMKEILDLKNPGGVLRICYSSSELPGGRALAMLPSASAAIATR